MADSTNEVSVVVVADDSAFMEAFEEMGDISGEVDEQLEDLNSTITQTFNPAPVNRFNNALNKTEKATGKADKGVKKSSKSLAGFNKTGGRSISMLSRFTGVGGKATRSLGGLAFALGGSPFGAFALAAAAATAAYSFFADKLGLDNDAIIKKNDKLRENISALTAGLEEDFKKGKLLAIDLSDLSEAEKNLKRISLLNLSIGSARLDLSKANNEQTRLEEQLKSKGKKTSTEILAIEEKIVEERKKRFDAQFEIEQGAGNIAAIEKNNAAQIENARKKRELAQKEMFNLFNSLIRDNRKKAILAVEQTAKVREEKANNFAKNSEERNRFLVESQAVLRTDLSKVNATFDAAELKARQALLIQLTADEESAAIQSAQNVANLRVLEITDIATNEAEKALFLKQSSERLEMDLAAIRKQFADKRKDEGLAERQEVFDAESALLESNIMREQAALNTELELDRQRFAALSSTEEEITAFKESQDEKRLTAELAYQIQRLQLVRDFNTAISEEEVAALDAQIVLLQSKLQGVGAKIKGTAKKDSEDGDGLFGLLGFSKDQQSNIQAVQGALEEVTGLISSALAERVAILDEEVQKRKESVEEKQIDLTNEIELNKLGKASNIELAKEALAEEKKARDKAEAEKKEAAKAQFAVDTALQASNLATAISGLYASLSGLPFGIGVALATVLSGVMIGSFVGSKVQAANAAGFAEGGFFGYTGDGGKHQESNALGSKPYNYHRGEYILDAETTSDLGLNNMPMSEARGMLMGSSMSDSLPNPLSVKKKNKSINKKIANQSGISSKRLQASYNAGVKDALSKQTKVLEAIRDKPVVLPLGNGKNKLIYPGKTILDTDTRAK